MRYAIRKAILLPTLGLALLVVSVSQASAQVPWPGQTGNAVGYSAYGPLGTTPWPGGSFVSGTASNPTIYKGYVFSGSVSITGSYIEFISCDFNASTGGVRVGGDHIAIIGSRFQSNDLQNYNVYSSGTNLTFLYDSFTPLASLYASPPGEVWPSAGAGTNTASQIQDVNCANGNDGYEYGIEIASGGPVTVDHSDIWGYGNAVVFLSTTAQIMVTNDWIHDPVCSGPQGYHTDGPGYLNGGSGPNNVTVSGNTIALLGNTNAIAFQAATSGYSNIQIDGNYLSGDGYTLAPGEPGTTHLSNSTVYGNVFGTDLAPVWGPLYGNSFPAGANTVWACNRMVFATGTKWTDGDGWTPLASIDGLYWIPSSVFAGVTDYNGNTVCPSVGPYSLAFKDQAVNSASASQTVTLKNTGISTLAISSISLQAGSQFAISANNCGASLIVGASCTVTVTFNPSSQGIQTDSLQFSDSAPAPSSPQSVSLVGFGVAAGSSGPPGSVAGVITSVR